MSKPRMKQVPSSKRNSGFRARMRVREFRQVQMWVPDLRQPAIMERYRRAARAIDADEGGEVELLGFVEEATDWSFSVEVGKMISKDSNQASAEFERLNGSNGKGRRGG
jgi:hypothetical protein